MNKTNSKTNSSNSFWMFV